MAPASLPRRTSRDSRSASLVISSCVHRGAVDHAALDDEGRVGLGEVTQTLGGLDRVALDEGDRGRAVEQVVETLDARLAGATWSACS